MKLTTQVALVTGASRGIGKATALRLAAEGCHVVINYEKSSEQAEKVVKEIQEMGRKAIAIPCDVSQEKQVEKMINQIIKQFGRIDIVVNNAGIVFDVPFFERTVEQWKRTLEVNLIGVFLVSKYAAIPMLKQKSGAIVNISSICGKDMHPTTSIDYNASKAGIITLTKSLAIELSPHIRVNAIAPGWIDTDINKDLPADYIKGETERILMKRFAHPNEIASVVAFLASEDASYITGSVFSIDGGYNQF